MLVPYSIQPVRSELVAVSLQSIHWWLSHQPGSIALVTFRQTSHRALPSFDQYQIILLGNRGVCICVWTTCPDLLYEAETADSGTRDSSITCLLKLCTAEKCIITHRLQKTIDVWDEMTVCRGNAVSDKIIRENWKYVYNRWPDKTGEVETVRTQLKDERLARTRIMLGLLKVIDVVEDCKKMVGWHVSTLLEVMWLALERDD